MIKYLISGWLLLGAAALAAQVTVTLPESGRLAGPLDETASEYGDEFFDFPDFLLPAPEPDRIGLNGWIEIQFGEVAANRVDFTVTYEATGEPIELLWGGGQLYDFSGNLLVPRPALNGGTLNLETGEIENIEIRADFLNRTTNAQLSKINRIPPGFAQLFPPPAFPLPLPPGFISREASFAYDSEGRISGFEFRGQTAVPLGFLAFTNASTQILPPFGLGPGGTISFPNPDACLPDTPAESCPTDADNPDGTVLPLEVLLHPHFFMTSTELREVPMERPALPCLPAAAVGGSLVAAAGKLYRLGGLAAEGPSGRVDVWDPLGGDWQAAPSLPLPVAETQAAAIGDRIYVAGGRPRPGGPATDRLQVLDSTSATWSELAPLPRAVAGASITTLGDRLFVLSGRTNRPNGSPAGNLRFNDTVQIYDPVTDSWQSYFAFADGIQVYRQRASAIAFGDDIYLVGGERLGGAISDQLLILDTRNNRFRSGPAPLWGVYDAAAGRIGDRLVVAGGRRQIDGPASAGVQVLEIDRGVWLEARQAPMATIASGAAVLEGELYVGGGSVIDDLAESPERPTRAVYAFDPGRGWQVCGSEPFLVASAVVNTASLTVGPRPLSPGSQASVSGWNLATETASAPSEEAFVPTELAGVRIFVDGLPAPMIAVDPRRLDFQIPYGVKSGDVRFELVNAATPQQAPAIEIPIVEAAPGIFIQHCGVVDNANFLDEAFALACNDDDTFHYMSNAVRPGAVLALQMTGLGAVDPPLANGERTPVAAPAAVLVPNVWIESEDGTFVAAQVLSAELAAGELGVFDVRFVVPASARSGNRVAVYVEAAGVSSNRAMISIGEAVAATPLACLRNSNEQVHRCLSNQEL